MKQKGMVFFGALAIVWIVASAGIFGTAAIVSHNDDAGTESIEK